MDIDIDIDWKRGDDPRILAKKLRTFDAALDDELEAAMEDAVTWVEADAKRNVSVDTGTLRASIASLVETDVKERVAGYVGSNVEYAPFVEYGTAPHVIRGDPLAFEGDGGETVFTDTVYHPGTEPQPYLLPAVEENRDRIVERFEQAVEDAAERVF